MSEQTLRGSSQEGPPQPHPGVGRVRRKRKAEARKVLVVLPAASCARLLLLALSPP